jgi:hypothetical protein
MLGRCWRALAMVATRSVPCWTTPFAFQEPRTASKNAAGAFHARPAPRSRLPVEAARRRPRKPGGGAEPQSLFGPRCRQFRPLVQRAWRLGLAGHCFARRASCPLSRPLFPVPLPLIWPAVGARTSHGPQERRCRVLRLDSPSRAAPERQGRRLGQPRAKKGPAEMSRQGLWRIGTSGGSQF